MKKNCKDCKDKDCIDYGCNQVACNSYTDVEKQEVDYFEED